MTLECVANKKLIITNHALLRYIERSVFGGKTTPERTKKYLDDNRDEIKCEVRALLMKAKEDRSFLNDTQKMIYLWEKYGYNRKFKFLVSGKSTFLVEESDSGKDLAVITTLT